MAPHLVVFNHSPANLRLFDAALSATGYQVNCFLQSLESVDLVAELQPDLLILAYFSGYMENEVEMISALRADLRTADIPILVVTTEPIYTLKARMPHDVRYVGFLEKPFDISKLLNAIEATLASAS